MKPKLRKKREFEIVSNLSYADLDPMMVDSFEGDY